MFRYLYPILFLCLSACASLAPGSSALEEKEVESKFQAGSIDIAAFRPIPWSLVRDDLQPNFGQTNARDLLDDVVPNVGGDDFRVRRSSQSDIRGNIAGPVINDVQGSQSETNTDNEGTTTTTSSSTQSNENTRATPETINVTAPSNGTSRAADIALNAAITSAGFDPNLQYRSATALFQNIQLLDRYLEHGVSNDDLSRAYLMRVQITVNPFARQQPYDIYTTPVSYTHLTLPTKA